MTKYQSQIDPEKAAKIPELFNEGQSMWKIAYLLKVSHQTVRKYLTLAGIPVFPRGGRPNPVTEEECERIVQLYLDGYTTKEIIDTVHRSFKIVIEALHSSDIRIRKTGERAIRVKHE